MSFKSRSCRLIGFFVPIDVNVRLPMVMGLEDKMIFRLAPGDLGAPSTWIFSIFNMTWKQIPHIQKLNDVSDEWNENTLSKRMLEEIQEMVIGDMTSRNEEDQKKSRRNYGGRL